MFLLLTTVLALVLYFVITLPVFLILVIMKRFNPVLTSKIAQPFVKAGFSSVLFFAGTKVIVLGTENIPKDAPVMFAANHRGLLDAAAAYVSLPVTTGFVAKNELKKAPFLSWWMELCSGYFLDRDDPRSGVKMVLTCIDHIANGISIFIAPEGTRSKTIGMNPFKEGSFKIATRSNSLIIPVAISGTDDIFENSKPFVKRSTVVIEYGKPIDYNSLPAEDKKFVGAYTQHIIGEMLVCHEQYITKNPSRISLNKSPEEIAALVTSVNKPMIEKKDGSETK